MGRFRATLLLIFGFVFFYIAFQLFGYNQFGSWGTWVGFLFVAAVIGIIASLPLFFWFRSDRRESKLVVLWSETAYLAMPYLNFLLLSVALRDISEGLLRLIGVRAFHYTSLETIVLLVVPVVLTWAGRFSALRTPRTIRIDITDPRIPKAFDRYRIVQLSDVHISSSMPEHLLKKIANVAHTLDSDLIVLTGDIIDGAPEQHRHSLEILKTLRGRDGTLMVPGNHEYYWGIDRIAETARGLGLQLLMNESHTLTRRSSSLRVAGVVDPTSAVFGGPSPALEPLRPASPDEFVILLCHQPGLADQAAAYGYGLQLSGHTHGGQLLPWTLLIGLFHRYPKGLYRIARMWLYVSQGTGFWGPTNRLGSHCEITEITLHSSQSSDLPAS